MCKRLALDSPRSFKRLEPKVRISANGRGILLILTKDARTVYLVSRYLTR